MTGPSDPDAETAARLVMRYLAAHGGAADTAEGIATWWLAGVEERPTVSTIERAMAWLIEQALVERQVLPDGAVIYRAARRTEQ